MLVVSSLVNETIESRQIRSVAAAAKEIGIAYPSLKKIVDGKTGQRAPQKRVIKAIASWLRVDEGQLMRVALGEADRSVLGGTGEGPVDEGPRDQGLADEDVDTGPTVPPATAEAGPASAAALTEEAGAMPVAAPAPLDDQAVASPLRNGSPGLSARLGRRYIDASQLNLVRAAAGESVVIGIDGDRRVYLSGSVAIEAFLDGRL